MNIIIDDSNEDERIDLFLANILPEFSRSRIQNQIKQGNCLVNNKKVKPSSILKSGDVIDFLLPELEHNLIVEPEEIPLDVVWEDENMAVINKPSGMLTHPTLQELSGTLVNALKFKYGENLSDTNGELRRGIVHRLDRNTSGLLIIAKNNKTHEYLAEQIKERNFVKKYIAIVKGNVSEDSFTINKPIGRHLTQPHKQAIREDGKESITLVKVLDRFSDASLVELTLVTGRTHQIRVHLSSIGHPIYNDTLYGFGKIKIKTEEQVLQSYKLEFIKPFSQDDKISLEIPYDSKVKKILKALKTL
jgi:23S rRNA pseudouridine1911/1915/1917 synthase